GRYIAGGAVLNPRVDLLVRQLTAELSGCRWCIEHGLHRWRQAFLPVAELGALRRYAASPLFSARERAALAFTEAVSRYTDRAGASGSRESGGALVAPHPSAPAQARLFQGQGLAAPAADRRGGDQELRLCIAPHRASQRRLSMAAARNRGRRRRGIRVPGRVRGRPIGRTNRGAVPSAAGRRVWGARARGGGGRGGEREWG